MVSRKAWGGVSPGAAFHRRGPLRALVLHHTAIADGSLDSGRLEAEATYMRRLEKLHLKRGWWAIGYHFVIMPSGRVLAGRPDWALGAHAEGHNRGTIGVALAGNFDRCRPAPAALRSLEVLRASLDPNGDAVPLLAHGDLSATACPGRFLNKYMERARVHGPPGA